VHYLCVHLLVRNMILRPRKLIENEFAGVDTGNDDYDTFVSLNT